MLECGLKCARELGDDAPREHLAVGQDAPRGAVALKRAARHQALGCSLVRTSSGVRPGIPTPRARMAFRKERVMARVPARLVSA